MSQSQYSQQSLNLNLPEMNLPDNFFSNFEEISKKYKDIEKKEDNIAAYENIIKNDSFNDINNIQFHNNISLKKNENKNKNKLNIDNVELIFDSPHALKLSGGKMIKKEINIDEEKNIFDDYLKSEYYINRNNKNYYEKNDNIYNDISDINTQKIEKPNLKEILSKKSWDDDVEFIKENIFNYKHFFPMQKEIINSVLMHKDIYVFFINEKYKDICYQIPAIISNEKIFLVIKSSNDVIKNEIKLMSELGIKVLDLSPFKENENLNLEKNFLNANFEENIQIIYCTPDKIYKNKNIFNLIFQLYQKGKIKTIVLDEINMMSKWDKNFDRNYFELKDIKKNFEKCNFLCFTNNPSINVRNNVINLLDIKKILNFKLSFNKPNIFFEVKNKKEINDIKENILNLIRNNNYENKSGIIYCSSEIECNTLTQFLFNENKIKCDCIHEGLFENNQKGIINKFISDEINIIITNIDFIEKINNLINNKKNIRFIIYYNVPKNFDIFYSQLYLLGLDSEPSKCIIYYDSNEINNKKNNNINIEEIRSKEKLIDFCEENYECRRKIFLSYFKEEFNKDNCYHMCDNCNKKFFIEKIDCTKECKDILNILIKNKEKEKECNKDELLEMLKNTKNITRILRYLIINEYIDEYFINNKSIIKITNLGENLYKDNITEIKILLPLGQITSQKKNCIKNNINNTNYRRNYETNIFYRAKGSFKSEYALELTNDYGLCEPTEFDDLLEQLKNIRRDLLKKENIKRKKDSFDGNFIPLELEDIISNEGLKELVRVLPTKEEDLNNNYILKKEKNLLLYKNEILPTILKFINIYNIDVNKRKENRQNNILNEINEENINNINDYQNKKEEFKIDGFNYDKDLFNLKYNNNVLDEGENKTFNDRNCLFIGIKRKKPDEQRINRIDPKTTSCIFNQLANKSKKNKKAKFL